VTERSPVIAPGQASDSVTPARGHLPDFVGIGTIKSGTTWLWACLREHPDVFMPGMKELEFFDTRYEKGLTWYMSLFEGAGTRRCGEISPQYLHDPRAVERMRFLAGHAKLLVAFRDPAERAYSHYLMDARDRPGLAEAERLRDFECVVARGGSKYVEFGHYARQLRPFIETFGPERLHCILFEDIRDRPREIMRGMFEFLGVDPGFVPSALQTKLNAAKRYRSARAFNLLRRVVRLAEMAGMSDLILYLKRTAVRDRVLRLLEVDESYTPLSPDMRRRLVEIFRESNRELSVMIGRDLDVWNRV
jgi:hypothetical protein